LKVWECALDLCRYIASIINDDNDNDNDNDNESAMDATSSSSSSSSSSTMKTSSIRSAVINAIGPNGSTLEIGCGHGMPGCLILREGARKDRPPSTALDDDHHDDHHDGKRDDDDDDDDDDRDDDVPLVVFSDFNDFVIRRATIPNAMLNFVGGSSVVRLPMTDGASTRATTTTTTFDDDDDDGRGNIAVLPSSMRRADDDVASRWTGTSLQERSIFVSGDWMGLSHMLSKGAMTVPHHSSAAIPSSSSSSGGTIDDDDRIRRKRRRRRLHLREGGRTMVSDRFDLILASETTYTTESCLDTAFLMLRHLRVDVGVGLVATKRFYFGVGGGTDAFISACE
jgi:hypothetical protein